MGALKVLHIVGCQTNFIKVMPLIAEMKKHSEICPLLVYTGQHGDETASDVFFRGMEVPAPDVSLDAGYGTYARQVALTIQGLEGVLLDMNPDLVLVAGDVNSTLASSLTAIPLGFPVAHLEAGLRSFDRETPEEINRVITDALSDILFTISRNCISNLLNEGRRQDQIFFVGSVIMDALAMNADKIARSDILEQLQLTPKAYAVVSRHRPENIEDPNLIDRITRSFGELERHIRLVFPIHPRTAAGRGAYGSFRQIDSLPNVQVIESLSYIDFIKLLSAASFVMTDSGGVQEETTALGIPCLTLRESTEQIITVTEGSNQLIGSEQEKITATALAIVNGSVIAGRVPEKWDGLASKRIASILIKNADTIKQLHASVRERGICTVALDQI